MFKIFETQKFWVQKIRIFSKLLKKISTIFLQFLRPKNFKYILICNCCNQTKDNPDNEDRSTPLSRNFFPLKKYKPVKLYNFHTKEVSVIYVN